VKRSKGKTIAKALLGLAALVALLLALPTVTGKQASTTAEVPASADGGSAARNMPPEPRADRARSDSPRIREAHSDGGYTYWLEHEGSRENSH